MTDEPLPPADQPPPPGGRKRGRRTRSNEEFRERIEFAAQLVSRRLYKSDIKRQLMARYHCDVRMCEYYIARARKLVVQWSGKTKDQHRVESLAFYENIVRTDQNEDRRMRAQERIDRLLGLEEPVRSQTELTGRAALPVTQIVVVPPPQLPPVSPEPEPLPEPDAVQDRQDGPDAPTP